GDDQCAGRTKGYERRRALELFTPGRRPTHGRHEPYWQWGHCDDAERGGCEPSAPNVQSIRGRIKDCYHRGPTDGRHKGSDSGSSQEPKNARHILELEVWTEPALDEMGREQAAARIAQAQGDSEPEVPARPQTGCNYSHKYASSHWRAGISSEGNQAPHSEAQRRPQHRDPFRLQQGEAGSRHQEIGDGANDHESYCLPPRLLQSRLRQYSTLDLFAEPLRNRSHYRAANPLLRSVALRSFFGPRWHVPSAHTRSP